jgi:hypothetical protein
MALSKRRLVSVALLLLLVATIGWTYYHSLVPAIHPDHDHGLENLAGGGFLRVEAVEGGRRNLVGRPERVLVLHWFELGSPASASELPAVVDYAQSVAADPDIEVVLVATGSPRETVLQWARAHGLPTRGLYVDPRGETAGLIGVRRIPETLIYDPEGHLAHQARGPMDWNDPQMRAAIQAFKQGGGEHQH